MSQPVWKLIANLHVNPIDYGGFFVYEDETGVYAPEAELLMSPDTDEDGEAYIVYRFILDRCTFVDGVLSDNKFHPEMSAWFANSGDKGPRYRVLGDIAAYIGADAEELIGDLCSADPIRRAHVYRAIGEYHGMDNLDSYPLSLTREEAEQRYAAFA